MGQKGDIEPDAFLVAPKQPSRQEQCQQAANERQQRHKVKHIGNAREVRDISQRRYVDSSKANCEADR